MTTIKAVLAMIAPEEDVTKERISKMNETIEKIAADLDALDKSGDLPVMGGLMAVIAVAAKIGVNTHLPAFAIVEGLTIAYRKEAEKKRARDEEEARKRETPGVWAANGRGVACSIAGTNSFVSFITKDQHDPLAILADIIMSSRGEQTDETALVIIDAEGKRHDTLVLHGDFRDEYAEAAKSGLDACMEVFHRHRDAHEYRFVNGVPASEATDETLS